MSYRKFAIALIVAGVAAGCTQQQVADNEAKAKAVLDAIANGARVTAAAVKEGIDAVCANQSDVAAGAMVVRAGFNTQSGPSTTRNLANLDKSLATLNNVCAQAAANPNDPALKSLLRTAWISYQSAKASQAAASGG